jgi:hypothetical protein
MTNAPADLAARIDALDDKQAIHVANSLVQAAFSTAPAFAGLDDDALLARVADGVQALDTSGEVTRLRASPNWADMPSTGREAGDLARRGLRALADAPDGQDLVTRALDEFFDAQADFGVLTGAAAIGFIWLILSGEINFKIGTFSYKKKGLSPAAQAKLAPAFIRDLGSKFVPGPVPAPDK